MTRKPLPTQICAMIGLLSGGWTEERLRQAGCIEVYRHPADLLARYNHSALRPAKGQR